MNKPLSFSGYKRFITCPKFYHYHDVLGEKSETMTSALVFGSAIDNALNEMLMNRDVPKAVLIAITHIDASKVDLFFGNDYDHDLSGIYLQELLDEKNYKGDAEELMKELLANQADLSVNEREVVDKAVKHSLRMKADIILKSYAQKVLPLVKEVETVQREIITKDGSKRGIIDTVLILNDGRRVLFDNKTASRPYERDSVMKSPQLALYASMYDCEYAGFIVMNKQITKNRKKICSKCSFNGSGTKFKTCNNITINNKKCGGDWNETIDPYSFIQIFIDKLPKINKTIINEAMDDTIKCINNGVYPRNLNNCFNMYGQQCPYVKKCWGGK